MKKNKLSYVHLNGGGKAETKVLEAPAYFEKKIGGRKVYYHVSTRGLITRITISRFPEPHFEFIENNTTLSELMGKTAPAPSDKQSWEIALRMFKRHVQNRYKL